MRLCLSVGLAIVFGAPQAHAQAPKKLEKKEVDALVEHALTEFDTPGAAVVVVKGDEVLFAEGYGRQRLGGKKRVTKDTVFPIASCSKPFTAALLAQLVREKKLSWDDRVADHLPQFRLSDPLADREVTFRDLLSHRTGMPRHDLLWVGSTTTTEDLLARWGKARWSTSFRSTWEYSNVPFTAAGYVAGKLNNGDWAGAAKKRLFDPLKMTNTSATAAAGQKGDHATPHYLGLDGNVNPVAWDKIDHVGGAGCVNSTAADMGQWLRAQLNDGQLRAAVGLTKAEFDEMHRRQIVINPSGSFLPYFPPEYSKNVSYGLGWFVHDYRGDRCVSHGGTLTGVRAQCMMVPEKQVGVFVVCNLRPSYLPEAVAKTLVDRLLGNKPLEQGGWVAYHKKGLEKQEDEARKAKSDRDTNKVAGTKPSLPVKDYAGAYEERAYGAATVTEKNDKLTLKWGALTFQLDHYHFDTFTATAVAPADRVVAYERQPLTAHFRLGPDGRVESLTFHDQVFRRQP